MNKYIDSKLQHEMSRITNYSNYAHFFIFFEYSCGFFYDILFKNDGKNPFFVYNIYKLGMKFISD